jgi:hypothetical protein
MKLLMVRQTLRPGADGGATGAVFNSVFSNLIWVLQLKAALVLKIENCFKRSGSS